MINKILVEFIQSNDLVSEPLQNEGGDNMTDSSRNSNISDNSIHEDQVVLMMENFIKASKLGPEAKVQEQDLTQEILCQTHQATQNAEVQATRYCKECDQPLCDNCVIEYHYTHIQNARFKIEEMVNNSTQDLKNLLSGISTILPTINIDNSVNEVNQTQEKAIHEEYEVRHKYFERMIGKLHNVIDNLKTIKKQLLKQVDSKKSKEMSLKTLKLSKIKNIYFS